MSELIKLDTEYAKWIQEIGARFKTSQIKASTKVNEEMLRFYWFIGKGISEREERNKYGSDYYRMLSRDLAATIPGTKSFSPTNLRYMKHFYDLCENFPQAEENFDNETNLPQLGGKFKEYLFLIPWGHIKLIIDRCKNNRDKALFFARETLENNWSRAVLMNFLDTDLFERNGKAISNFASVLPAPQSDLAQAMTKDPYNFDFLTIQENYNEKELKDALMANVQSFLLELGMGFAFAGREYRLEVGQTEQFLDMLFYNINNHCYVVVEIKTRDFEPGDMGQLGTYVAAVDGTLKREGDNQTVGLLICKTKDNVLAQYAVNVVNAPIGISEYKLSNLIPENFKSSMPTIEQIERELGYGDKK